MSNPCDYVVDTSSALDARTDVTAAITVDASQFGDVAAFVVAAVLVSGVAVTDVVTQAAASMVTDSVSATDAVQAPVSVSSLVLDEAAAVDAMLFSMRNDVIDAAALSDALAAVISQAMVDASVVGFAVAAPVMARNDVADVAGLSDTAAQCMVSLVLDAVALADANVEVRIVADFPVDGVTVSAAITQANLTSQLVVDASTGSVAVADELVAVNVVTVETFVADEMSVPGGAAWTALLETWGMSRYDRMPYNSIAEADGRLFVAGGGLFALEGGTDDGAQIAARIQTAIRDMGQLARPRYCYAGYTSNGNVAITITGAEDGTPESYTIPFPVRSSVDWPTPNRVKLGRGLRSRYYRFGFENQAGADFVLNDLRIILDEAARRV